jgi:hypothetical protein
LTAICFSHDELAGWYENHFEFDILTAICFSHDELAGWYENHFEFDVITQVNHPANWTGADLLAFGLGCAQWPISKSEGLNPSLGYWFGFDWYDFFLRHFRVDFRAFYTSTIKSAKVETTLMVPSGFLRTNNLPPGSMAGCIQIYPGDYTPPGLGIEFDTVMAFS